MKKIVIIILIIIIPSFSFAAFKDNEQFQFPLGMATGNIQNKKDLTFSLYPIGYLFYGVTDRLTIGWDWWGVFLKIPAFDFKYKLTSEKDIIPGIVFDFYFFILPELIDDTLKIENDYDDIFLAEKGHKHSFHLNFVKTLKNKTKFHLSAGYAYGNHLELYEQDEEEKLISGETHTHYFSRSVIVGLEHVLSRKLAFVGYWSTGDTLLNYLDQIPFKTQTSFGILYSPFSRKKYWLEKLRFELGIIYYKLDDFDLDATLPNIGIKLIF